MGTGIQRDDTRLVHLLLHDCDIARTLDNFIVDVVTSRDAWQRRANHTTRVQGEIFGTVVRFPAAEAFIGPVDGIQFGQSFLALRRQRRNAAVGRIVDQRRPSIGPSTLPPERVVCIIDVLIAAGRSAFVCTDGRFLVLFTPLFGRQKLSALILRRPLERRGCGVRPGSLKIRIAPGSPPHLCGRRLRLTSSARRHERHCRDYQRENHLHLFVSLRRWP